VRLLLHRGADVNLRDIGDNATALHFAAHVADLAVVRDLVEAGADVVGAGDDHQLGVLGWATCFRETRTEIANYLLDRGAPLDIWSAIALEGAADVRRLVAADPGLLVARMSRNEHRRTPLHHAAAKNRPATVRLLLELGADALATDAAGATPLTAAAQANADPAILGMLQAAGATLDLTAALSMGRFDLAEAMLRDDPTRIGMEGRDTIALHLAVARRDMPALRWLIGHGVAVNAKRVLWDCNGTALHMTAEHGLAEIARLLLQAGADPTICDDKYNATVPEWAEYCGQPDVARVLKEAPRSG
jgi:ankyrin repeat protein